MEISKLKTLTTPNLNDVLPILDINGGLSGKPILRKATLSSLLALAQGDNSSGFEVPTIIKTVADSGDYFIGIDSTGTPYKITKANFLAGLSSGGSSGISDSHLSNVPLLLHGNGSSIINNGSSAYSVSISNSNGVVTSAIKSKFDGSSLKLANPSFLDCVSSAFNVGSQDCTIELFFNPDTTLPTGNGQILFEMRPDNSNGNFPQVAFDGTTIALYQNGATRIASTQSISANNWYYAALKKTGGLTELWFQGAKVGEYFSGDWGAGGRVLVGALAFRSVAPDTYFNGYMDEFRFSLGIARDVSIIPTTRFPDN